MIPFSGLSCLLLVLFSTYVESSESRYLLYDVNPGEGFNLRRDVFIRMGNLLRFLNEKEKWTLVLPPWGRIYHWYSSPPDAKIPWSQYFNIESLRHFIPVIEFEEYKKITGEPVIDEVYYLEPLPITQNEEGFASWEDKYEIQKCGSNNHGYYQEKGKWRGWFFGHEANVYARKFACLGTLMEASAMTPFLLNDTRARSVMFDRAEVLIHGMYSEWSPEYWTARRSMVFSERLHKVAMEFMRNKMPEVISKKTDAFLLNWHPDWRLRRKYQLLEEEAPPYLAIHLRRQDFVKAHREVVPSIHSSAEQALTRLRHLNLTHLFVATDMPESEMKSFRGHFPADIKVFRFATSTEKQLTDGCLAIIDQILCSKAQHFMGTCESTFSFRIHEEREIHAQPPLSTFNCFCFEPPTSMEKACRQPTHWRIQFEPKFTQDIEEKEEDEEEEKKPEEKGKGEGEKKEEEEKKPEEKGKGEKKEEEEKKPEEKGKGEGEKKDERGHTEL